MQKKKKEKKKKEGGSKRTRARAIGSQMPVTRMALYIYKYARVDACQKPGRGWQRDDTKGLIVLAGDSRGLHGRWPGNGYFYRRIRAYTFQWPPGNPKAREEVSYTSH